MSWRHPRNNAGYRAHRVQGSITRVVSVGRADEAVLNLEADSITSHTGCDRQAVVKLDLVADVKADARDKLALVERDDATVAGTDTATRGPWQVLPAPPPRGGGGGRRDDPQPKRRPGAPAREKLGCVRPGETGYIVLDPPGSDQVAPVEVEPLVDDDKTWVDQLWEFISGKDLGS